MAGAATGLGIVAVSLLHRAPAGHAAGPTDAPSTLIASSVQPRAALDAERQRLASQPCKPSPEYTPPGDGPTKVPAPAATW